MFDPNKKKTKKEESYKAAGNHISYSLVTTSFAYIPIVCPGLSCAVP